ncbi:MAG: acyltransferase family protein [Microbacterium sp.]|jgi:surface polysaccharide O-acyltransferase-like enzyme|nr:acyltransferase family protein [Microbacterium sp.]
MNATATATRATTRRWSLDVTRVVAVMGVAAIHVFAGLVANPVRHGSAGWWGAVVVDIGFVWVVPVFVMISGALILEPRQYEQGPSSFYRRRLLRLAPALVFWSLFYFFVIRTALTGASISRADLVRFFLEGRPYTHLYFLWLIVGLYAVAPVFAAFLKEGGQRRAVIFATTVLVATVVTGSSSSLLTAMGDPRPLTLLALTQWLPYAGYFLAGWALRGLVLRGWRLAVGLLVTFVALVVPIAQYGLRPRTGVLDAVAPVSYFGPFVAIASIGVFVCANSLLSGWTPRERGARILRELSDSAFGVFLVHFAIMLVMRRTPLFAAADSSFLLTVLEWVLVVVLSFAVVYGIRRIPYLRRVV